ncbi:MAG: peptidylprolyl isomerase [Clostridia bacterium]|nr:peptidylprolyl isomerase [Clostridia bacterium]MBR0407912.1 peptidylprolyl isomerase [Clostridia bacterium]
MSNSPKKSKTIAIVCAVVVVLAAAFCLYQFTDIFGAKQNNAVPAEAQSAPEATVAVIATDAPTEAPAPTDAPAPTEAPAEETPAEPSAEEQPAAEEEPAAEEAQDENPVLATLDGNEITLTDTQAMLSSLVSGGYITDSTDYKTALDYLIQTRVLAAKITELGFDQFTDEEKADFAAKAEAEWNEAIEQYVSYFGGAEDTNVEQTRQEAVAYYAAHGITEESIARQYQAEASQEKLEAYLLEGKNVAVTEEEIQALFDQAAEQDKASIGGNIGTYELYQAYYGQQFFYMPEGYRGIIHILLDVDEALMDAYTQAQSAYEESVTEEKPDGDEALKAAVDEARQAILDSRKETIDDIYARLEKGEEFTALIAEYNQDPGMKDESRLADGYLVHQESLIWDPVFTAAAFSEKMVKPGDVSDPVVGQNGIHILYYLRDVPGGKVEMTDEIRAEIETYLDSSKKNQVFSEALSEWMTQHEIVYNQEAIYALTNSAETTAE